MSALPPVKYLQVWAELSECGRYRYLLGRTWDLSLPVLVFVMLNPSTADGKLDDPTVRKCVGFARRNCFGGIVVVNLWAWRATHPTELRACAADPNGPENDVWISRALDLARPNGKVVAAWGVNVNQAPWMRERARRVLELLRRTGDVHALKVTGGTPHHPLMLSYELKPEVWRP